MTLTTRLARLALALALAAVALPVLTGARGCKMPSSSAERKLTVLLVEYEGPEAVASGRRIQQELVSQGLTDAFVVEGAQQASVCVGRYDSWQDADADAMLKRVRQIRDTQGQYPFAGVLLVPVPEPLPPNPWPLEEAKGVFTLHIASWEAPGRMAAAQAYAEQLRSGGYEAYVQHGQRLSMVMLGAFGPGIFDDPAAVGRPGGKPKVVDPKVLALIQKFPRMRLEGQETPPEAHVPTSLVRVPGRDAPVGPSMGVPKVLYRVSVSFVDTATGVAEGRGVISGVAQSEKELPWLVGTLVRQLVENLDKDKAHRAGIVGTLAANQEAAAARADATVTESVTAAVKAAGKGRVVVSDPRNTALILDAAGLRADAILRDARPAKGLRALDILVTATVTAFPR